MSNIEQYNALEAALKQTEESGNFIPDVTTKEGYEKSKRVYLDGRKVWNAIDKTRKELGADARKMVESINSEGKVLLSRVDAAINAHGEAYKAHDAEIKRKKEEAEQRELDKIESIKQMANGLAMASIEEIGEAIKSADAINFDDTPEKFLKLASDAKTHTMGVLNELMSQAIERKQVEEQQEAERQRLEEERKKQEAERAELEKLRAEQAERDRIAAEEAAAKQAEIDKANAEAQAKIDEENRKIEEEKRRVEMERQAKEKAERELKERQEREEAEKAEQEAERQRKAELAPDKEKLFAFANGDLEDLIAKFPSVAKPEAQELSQKILQQLSSIQARIIAAAEEL